MITTVRRNTAPYRTGSPKRPKTTAPDPQKLGVGLGLGLGLGLGVRCSTVKGVPCGRVYFTPRLYRRVRAELLAGIVYLGHLYAGESGQFRPLIFLDPVWYDAVRCGPVRCFVGPMITV